MPNIHSDDARGRGGCYEQGDAHRGFGVRLRGATALMRAEALAVQGRSSYHAEPVYASMLPCHASGSLYRRVLNMQVEHEL